MLSPHYSTYTCASSCICWNVSIRLSSIIQCDSRYGQLRIPQHTVLRYWNPFKNWKCMLCVGKREENYFFFSYKPALNHNYLSFTVACSLFTNNINDFVCLSNCMIDRPTDRQTDRPYRLTDRTKERKVFSIPIFKTQQDFYRFKAI